MEESLAVPISGAEMPPSKPNRSTRPDARRRLNEVRELFQVGRIELRRRKIAAREAASDYFLAERSINECDASRDRQINELHSQIEQLEREYEVEITQWRGQQGRAVLTIRELGETEVGIAELLDLTINQVRRILATERAARRAAGEASKRTKRRA